MKPPILVKTQSDIQGRLVATVSRNSSFAKNFKNVVGNQAKLAADTISNLNCSQKKFEAEITFFHGAFQKRNFVLLHGLSEKLFETILEIQTQISYASAIINNWTHIKESQKTVCQILSSLTGLCDCPQDSINPDEGSTLTTALNHALQRLIKMVIDEVKNSTASHMKNVANKRIERKLSGVPNDFNAFYTTSNGFHSNHEKSISTPSSSRPFDEIRPRKDLRSSMSCVADIDDEETVINPIPRSGSDDFQPAPFPVDDESLPSRGEANQSDSYRTFSESSGSPFSGRSDRPPSNYDNLDTTDIDSNLVSPVEESFSFPAQPKVLTKSASHFEVPLFPEVAPRPKSSEIHQFPSIQSPDSSAHGKKNRRELERLENKLLEAKKMIAQLQQELSAVPNSEHTKSFIEKATQKFHEIEKNVSQVKLTSNRTLSPASISNEGKEVTTPSSAGFSPATSMETNLEIFEGVANASPQLLLCKRNDISARFTPIASYVSTFGDAKSTPEEFIAESQQLCERRYSRVSTYGNKRIKFEHRRFNTNCLSQDELRKFEDEFTAKFIGDDLEREAFILKQKFKDKPLPSIESQEKDIKLSASSSPPNLLYVIDVSKHLIFKPPNDGDDADYVRGGTVDGLVAYLTSVSKVKEVLLFCEAFLTTYRTFMSPAELIEKLLMRYRLMKQSNEQNAIDCARNALTMVGRATRELGSEVTTEISKQLHEVFYELISEGELLLAKMLRMCINEASKTPQNLPQAYSSSPIQLNIKKTSLLDFKARELAENMTIIAFNLFKKVDIIEMLKWVKNQKEEEAPNLTKFTEHFNALSFWIRTQILTCQKQNEREKVYHISVKIMKHLRSMNNFNSLLAVLSALQSAPITRLEWPKQSSEKVEEFSSLADCRGSFKNYRAALARADKNCIPYLGLVLQDITFIHIGNPDELPNGYINFGKHWQQFFILDNIRQFKQQTNIDFNQNEKVLHFFNDFKDFLPEEALYQRSLSIKPRGS